ncbi:hypothetical protein [Sinorhizobium meliloti]|uniref:hypothetical protein n=1 Tax=Rhizobium meliloti TaxID=382 RepID=UPI003D9FFC5B
MAAGQARAAQATRGELPAGGHDARLQVLDGTLCMFVAVDEARHPWASIAELICTELTEHFKQESGLKESSYFRRMFSSGMLA